MPRFDFHSADYDAASAVSSEDPTSVGTGVDGSDSPILFCAGPRVWLYAVADAINATAADRTALAALLD